MESAPVWFEVQPSGHTTFASKICCQEARPDYSLVKKVYSVFVLVVVVLVLGLLVLVVLVLVLFLVMVVLDFVVLFLVLVVFVLVFFVLIFFGLGVLGLFLGLKRQELMKMLGPIP